MDVKSLKIWRAFGLSKMMISISFWNWAQGRFQILKWWFLIRRSNNLKSFLSNIRRNNGYYNNYYEWCYYEYKIILSRFVHIWSRPKMMSDKLSAITLHRGNWSMQTVLHQRLQISSYSPLDFSGVKPEDMEWVDWSDFIIDYSETNPCVSAVIFLTLTR